MPLDGVGSMRPASRTGVTDGGAEGLRPAAAGTGADAPPAIARRIRVRGLVQGVGFRPFVFRLAHELNLDGCVRNDGEGVEIDVAGPADALDALIARLHGEAPPLARITSVDATPLDAPVSAGFRIEHSVHGAVTTGITPDAAVCRACLAELFDVADRRYRYPFINCTHCGPRFTITAALPYDRPNTSMAPFMQCAACQQQYDDPRDRRFHAQPNACPQCGPQLWLTEANGARIDTDDVIAQTMQRIARGDIVAIKGLGGFQLVCDARNAQAVARLRARKHRDEKPFAVMAANVASIDPVAQLDNAAAALLTSPAAPIVLLPRRARRADHDEALAGIAPGLGELGLMLPTAPLHWLLFHEAAGRPSGSAWTQAPQPLLLVMTSANPGGEPLVIGNDEAIARLGGIADAFVMHDREVLVRCDDSVVRIADCGVPVADARAGSTRVALGPEPARSAIPGRQSVQFLRRARGYTPAPIALPAPGPAVLALGGYLKNTACLTRSVGGRGEAFLSQHIGDLDSAASCEALEGAVAHLCRVLELRPEAVAHDLHPDFFSTQLALRLADELGVPAIGVQHHHAHIGAVCAEHGVTGPVLGIALDGVGHGEDDAFATGTVWGGELLRVDGARSGAHAERLGHLQPLALPGGDRAAREPWRMAAAALHALGRSDEIATRFADQPAAAAVADMLARGLRTPPTTSAGRWFDAAVGLLGLRRTMAYEGQAAMLLEAAATARGEVAVDDALLAAMTAHDAALDLLPLAARLADERDIGRGAALFHAALADALAHWAARAARRHNLDTVALGGGVFLNQLLTPRLRARLSAQGFTVITAAQAPVNDGGLALGQAWVAMQRLNEGSSDVSRPARARG